MPVIDNFERALVCDENASEQSLKDGMELIYKQLNEILKSNGVDEIESVGKEFDPNLHAAMLHIEDESVGENTIVDQFQKGYIYKDKVIRHSPVKVAN